MMATTDFVWLFHFIIMTPWLYILALLRHYCNLSAKCSVAQMRCQRLVKTFEQTLLKWQHILEKAQFFPGVQYCILTLYAVSLWVSFSFVNSIQQSTAILHSGGKMLLQPNWLFLLHGNYLPRNTTVEGQITFNKKNKNNYLGYFTGWKHCIAAVATSIVKAEVMTYWTNSS